MRISDWSSDVCSSDLLDHLALGHMGRTVERHMFEEMGEAALVFGFGEAADVEAHTDDDAVFGRAVFDQRILPPVRVQAEDDVSADRTVAPRAPPSPCRSATRLAGLRPRPPRCSLRPRPGGAVVQT